MGHIWTSSGGEMAEWFKAHAWKACVVNPTVGSNPSLSANFFIPYPSVAFRIDARQ